MRRQAIPRASILPSSFLASLFPSSLPPSLPPSSHLLFVLPRLEMAKDFSECFVLPLSPFLSLDVRQGVQQRLHTRRRFILGVREGGREGEVERESKTSVPRVY